MYKEIAQYISSLDQQIADSRKPVLDSLTDYIKEHETPKLNFICTHNSRRSHLSQVWAQVMAFHFGVDVLTYSGGTEATALHPNAVEALRRAGLQVESNGGDNPRYQVTYSDDRDPMICFSKTFDDPSNPASDFAAVMTCTDADVGCPLVPGADARIKLFYEDPKVSDGTPDEAKTYDERCRQVASEMLYVFSKINN